MRRRATSPPLRAVAYGSGPLTVADYDSALAALRAARAQLRSAARGEAQTACAVCGDVGHTADACHHNPLVLARRGAREGTTWRCYHCGERFQDAERAEAHFGTREEEVARCLRRRPPAPPPAAPPTLW